MARQEYLTKQEKLQHLKTIADSAIKHVSLNKTEWRNFLRFYAQVYKYTFPEALLLYEQAPYVTACGEIKHWNMVGRRVHAGTKGIPIINERDINTPIRYVFDVKDTYGEDRGIPRRWTLPEKYQEPVLLLRQLNIAFYCPAILGFTSTETKIKRRF